MFTRRVLYGISVVVLVAVIAFTIREAIATASVAKSIPLTSESQDLERVQRARAADAARLTGQAERYLRSRSADAARWMGIAERYLESLPQVDLSRKRMIEADAARWNAMAEHYLKGQAAPLPGLK